MKPARILPAMIVAVALAVAALPPGLLAAPSDVQEAIATAASWQARGMYRQALARLDGARANHPTARQMVVIARMRGDLYQLLHQWEQAGEAMARSVELARQQHDDLLLAKSLNNYGNLMATAGLKEEATAAFKEGIDLLTPHHEAAAVIQRATTEINLYRLDALQSKPDPSLPAKLARLAEEIRQLPATADTLQLTLALATLAADTKGEDALQQRLLRHALAQSQSVYRPELTAMTHGMLGHYLERHRRFAAAVKQTRQAIFFTPERAPEQRYRWQWQLGRIFTALHRKQEALTAYRAAVGTLTPIRSMLLGGHRMAKADYFARQIKPVYSELAALILAKVPQAASERQRQTLLREARDVMEELKTAELQNFFHSACVTASGAKMKLEDVDPYTAIIYPVVLHDHLAVIVSVGDTIKLYNAAVDAQHLRQTTYDFRRHLQTRTSYEFLHEATRLYRWIIQPAEPLLAARRVNQLVIVPDGALRTIPFSTLYDGHHFLIEHYPLAVTPGLSLTDPQPMVKTSGTTLVAGLSDAVQGFSALPSVKQEMKTVQSIMGGERLANKAYTIPALERALKGKEYRLIHLATHGVFAHSNEDSFLLTYDGKLNMNKLADLFSINKQRKHPVELLTMSACQTALGDDRAALGLAGVAVQAGVRSAIATLWFVDDEATALTITNFYKQLKRPGISKARALQLAQIQLIKQKRYWHPGYWGPFLLIGNWL